MGARSITNQRLRQRGWAAGPVPQMHFYILSTSDRFCLYLQLINSRDNQKTSFGTGVLEGCAHEFVNELFQHHLARERLRDFDHRREIEIFDRSFDHARRARRMLVLPQPRMQLVELPHLSVGSPSQIAAPCVFQVEMRNVLETAHRVKAGRKLVGERLNVHEVVRARRTDRPFIEALCVDLPIFDSGYLGADDCGAAFKILRAVSYPFHELSVAGTQCRDVLLEIIRRCAVAGRSMALRTIEVSFRGLEKRW